MRICGERKYPRTQLQWKFLHQKFDSHNCVQQVSAYSCHCHTRYLNSYINWQDPIVWFYYFLWLFRKSDYRDQLKNVLEDHSKTLDICNSPSKWLKIGDLKSRIDTSSMGHPVIISFSDKRKLLTRFQSVGEKWDNFIKLLIEKCSWIEDLSFSAGHNLCKNVKFFII